MSNYNGMSGDARRMFFNQGNMSSQMGSGNAFQYPTTPHGPAQNSSSPRTPQGPPMGRYYGGMAVQSTPSRESYGRSAFARTAHVSTDGVASTMVGIPEVHSVQEFAFRAGQSDYGTNKDRLPPSPFAPQYDELWLEYYVLGKACQRKPATRTAAAPQPTGLQNFPWTALINPYTQDFQNPGGVVDPEWVRKICGLALGCMAALVAAVCKREGDWKPTVCDVPGPIKQAIMHFPDLRARYEALQRDARVALAGGLPIGY